MPSLSPLAFDAYVVTTAFLGNTAAFALGDGTVRLASSGDPVTVTAHNGGLLAAVTDLEGRALVTGGDDGRVVRIAADGKAETVATRDRKWIDRLAAGPGGAIAFASGRTAWVKLADGSERAFEHPRAVGGLAFAPKGLRLAVARYDGVTLWWAATDAPSQSLEWKGMHTGATFSPDGRYLVTTMQENALHGWRLADGKHMRMTGYPTKVRSISWSTKGRFLATAGANAAVLWPFHFKDGPMGKPPAELGFRQEGIATAVACHPSDEVTAIGYSDGTILAARMSDGASVMLRPADGTTVSALAWSRDGLNLAFGTETGAAGIIDIGG